jgi:hypothetical protein
MTQNLIKGLVALGVVAVLALAGFAFLAPAARSLSGVNAYQAGIWQFGNGIVAGLSGQLAVDSSGNLSITNTSATSTIAAGCMQLNATSSATNVKLVLSTKGHLDVQRHGLLELRHLPLITSLLSLSCGSFGGRTRRLGSNTSPQ